MKSIEKNEKSPAGENEIERVNSSPVLYFETTKNDLLIYSDKAIIFPSCILNYSNGFTFLEDKPPKI